METLFIIFAVIYFVIEWFILGVISLVTDFFKTLKEVALSCLKALSN